MESVVSDPTTVLADALQYTPWTANGGNLPQRDDWSTLRYAAKDIVFGSATVRFNQTRRRLDVRAYFVGEHPMYEELEPTRAMLVILFCQTYQTGGTLELNFEAGIPFDVRQLVERRLGIRLSGHETSINPDLAARLFASLSQFSDSDVDEIVNQQVSLTAVCFQAFRDVWSPNIVKSFIRQRVPLSWLFGTTPGAVTSASSYWALIQHLRAALVEEFVVRRLEDRAFGRTLVNRIERNDSDGSTTFESVGDVHIAEEETSVTLGAGQPFCILPVIRLLPIEVPDGIREAMNRLPVLAVKPEVIVGLPLDAVYHDAEAWSECLAACAEVGCHRVVVGLTAAQLMTEAEQILAVTASLSDPEETDALNVDRHTD